MTTLEEFAGKCARAPAELEKAKRDGTRKAALGLTQKARAATVRATGDSVMSGVGRKGRKVGAKFEILGNGTAIVKATGPYQLLERDTSAHDEPRKRKRRGGKRRYVVIPGVGVRSSVHHPGTKGKHTFENAVDAGKPDVPKAYQREVHQALVRTFR